MYHTRDSNVALKYKQKRWKKYEKGNCKLIFENIKTKSNKNVK